MSDVCLVDSDTLSELSRGHPRVTANVRAYLERQGRLTLSAITIFERLRGYRAALVKGKPFERQLEAFEALAAACRVLPVDEIVADRAATYWACLGVRARRALGDILIAATASVNGLSLVTRNRRDFEPLVKLDPSLQLRDWAR
jgi:predicted nucleic acid-binding protein